MNRFEHISYNFCSETGAVRDNNEDVFLSMPDEGGFAVADGMGGASAGEVASAMLCDELRKKLSQSVEDSPGLRKYNAHQAIHSANDAILAYAEEHHYSKMGTTLVLFLLDSWYPDKALLCHVGDSRAYRLRKNELTQLTTDHNIGMMMTPRRGLFRRRPSEAEERAARLLTRAVGISKQLLPDWRELDIQPGDWYLLCTDGLSTMLPDKAIREILKQSNTPEQAVAALREGILQAGAQDNFTVCCLRVNDRFPPVIEADEEEQKESDYLMGIAEWRKDNA